MRHGFHSIKTGLAIIAAAIMFLGAATPSHAETGSVRISIGKAGFIVGVGGGNGVLSYHGRSYPLSIGGVSIGTIGVAQANLSGRAYNLRSAGDIVGTYAAVSSSAAVGVAARYMLGSRAPVAGSSIGVKRASPWPGLCSS